MKEKKCPMHSEYTVCEYCKPTPSPKTEIDKEIYRIINNGGFGATAVRETTEQIKTLLNTELDKKDKGVVDDLQTIQDMSSDGTFEYVDICNKTIDLIAKYNKPREGNKQ